MNIKEHDYAIMEVAYGKKYLKLCLEEAEEKKKLEKDYEQAMNALRRWRQDYDDVTAKYKEMKEKCEKQLKALYDGEDKEGLS